MLTLPHICAVMVTGKDTQRYPLARQAVAAFQAQTYPHKQLLVINDSPIAPLFDLYPPPTGVREVRAPEGTLGQLRNHALELIAQEKSADLLMQWDDDDFSDPLRMTTQYAHWYREHAIVFKWEIHCHLQTGRAFANNGHSQQGIRGFPGTIMHPVNTPFRYPDKPRGEDSDFVKQWARTNRLIVLNNSPQLYIRFFHGYNTWDEKHVMRKYRGSRELTTDERVYVDRILARYREPQ